MAEGKFVEPDLNFIKDVTGSGGDTLKKCYQCATCSVVCSISPDTNPFPRKEMIWAQWGLKDKLLKDPDVWLCHHCSDCTTHCPRGAKPGEVLSAVRKLSIEHYAPIKGIAKLAGSLGGMAVLLVVPAVILFIMMLLNGTFPPPPLAEGEAVVYSRVFPQLTLIDPVFVAAALFGIFSAYLGVKKFWADLKENTTETGNTMPLKESIIETAKEFLSHSKFEGCGERKDRKTSHMLVFWAFVGLFIVTNSVLVIHWAHEFGYTLLGPDTPLGQLHPIKLLGNISGVALVVGCFWLIGSRMKASETGADGSFNDWSLLMVIATIGITGFLAEYIRVIGAASLAYFVYFLHLMFVFYLFAFMPYMKFAHIVYRFTAIVHAKHTGRELAKEPVIKYPDKEVEAAPAA